MIEHTAWVLNKFHLEADGRTGYGRLHGREGRENVCGFGERIMWFVPKKLRGKLDQRWRYGTFLGRSLSSDQNFIGTNSGDVVCARAIVRVVPNMRWDPERISRIKTSPMEFKIGNLDRIEEESDPHAHPEPSPDGNEARQIRRLRIMDADVRKHGFTDSCQRCEFLRQNKALQARGTRHNEECRERMYEAMRVAGTEKLQRADLEGSARTQTRSKKIKDPDPPIVNEPMDAQANLDDAPNEPLSGMNDVHNDPTSYDDEPKMNSVDDTHDFYKEVDDALEVDWNGPEVEENDGDHVMASLVDVLQTIGVSAADAVAYSVRAVKNRQSITGFGTPYNPTVFEMYGHGSIINASHGVR